jgi:predicted transporter
VEEVRLWKKGASLSRTEAVETSAPKPCPFCVGKAVVSLWRKCDSRFLGLVHAGWYTAGTSIPHLVMARAPSWCIAAADQEESGEAFSSGGLARSS